MTASTRRRTGPGRETVMLVLDRDGYRCVRCDASIVGERGRDWDLHHRRPRGLGGTRRLDTNSPSNLLSLCRPCHDYVESHRGEGIANGWLVSQYVNPVHVACLVDGRLVYLLDDGTVVDK